MKYILVLVLVFVFVSLVRAEAISDISPEEKEFALSVLKYKRALESIQKDPSESNVQKQLKDIEFYGPYTSYNQNQGFLGGLLGGGGGDFLGGLLSGLLGGNNYPSYPTAWPTGYPTAYPTGYPTAWPTGYPTAWPTGYPTGWPTAWPTGYPTSHQTLYSNYPGYVAGISKDVQQKPQQ